MLKTRTSIVELVDYEMRDKIMLVPAILYKDEIIKSMQKYFYTDDMIYETGCMNNLVKNWIGVMKNE